jgi:Na+-transporting NADH:ubiquinone oxidoreductase subunit A
VISGSVLSGRSAFGPIHGYLGRYHHQISVLREGREREFMGWIAPGKEKFSVLPIFLSKLLKRDAFEMTTSTHGGVRAIVPIGTYEKVTPFDMVMTYLLRSLAVGDVETCEKLGVLELDEEDVALATFVCPCKNDYGPMLREVLDTIEREG